MSADECAAGPYEEHAEDDGCEQVDERSSPVALVAEYPKVVGKRRECGETAAESRDEHHVFAGSHHMGFFEQTEEQAYDEAADNIYEKGSHRKRTVEHG